MESKNAQGRFDDELKDTIYTDEIKDHTIKPFNEECEDADGEKVRIWAFVKKKEYYIVYDNSADLFGLAFKNILNEMVYLGPSGNLTEAYEDLISRQ